MLSDVRYVTRQPTKGHPEWRVWAYDAAARRRATIERGRQPSEVEFKIGGPFKAPSRSEALALAAAAHGTPATRALRSAGHTGKRDPMNDPEVQHALGVLRDARAQRQGKQGYVYLIWEQQANGGLRYGKVGYSTNPQARIAELQTGNPRKLVLLYAKPGTQEDEAELHRKYQPNNVLQEWFYITKELLLEFDPEHKIHAPAAMQRAA